MNKKRHVENKVKRGEGIAMNKFKKQAFETLQSPFKWDGVSAEAISASAAGARKEIAPASCKKNLWSVMQPLFLGAALLCTSTATWAMHNGVPNDASNGAQGGDGFIGPSAHLKLRSAKVVDQKPETSATPLKGDSSFTPDHEPWQPKSHDTVQRSTKGKAKQNTEAEEGEKTYTLRQAHHPFIVAMNVEEIRDRVLGVEPMMALKLASDDLLQLHHHKCKTAHVKDCDEEWKVLVQQWREKVSLRHPLAGLLAIDLIRQNVLQHLSGKDMQALAETSLGHRVLHQTRFKPADEIAKLQAWKDRDDEKRQLYNAFRAKNALHGPLQAVVNALAGVAMQELAKPKTEQDPRIVVDAPKLRLAQQMIELAREKGYSMQAIEGLLTKTLGSETLCNWRVRGFLTFMQRTDFRGSYMGQPYFRIAPEVFQLVTQKRVQGIHVCDPAVLGIERALEEKEIDVFNNVPAELYGVGHLMLMPALFPRSSLSSIGLFADVFKVQEAFNFCRRVIALSLPPQARPLFRTQYERIWGYCVRDLGDLPTGKRAALALPFLEAGDTGYVTSNVHMQLLWGFINTTFRLRLPGYHAEQTPLAYYAQKGWSHFQHHVNKHVQREPGETEPRKRYAIHALALYTALMRGHLVREEGPFEPVYSGGYQKGLLRVPADHEYSTRLLQDMPSLIRFLHKPNVQQMLQEVGEKYAPRTKVSSKKRSG